MISIKSYLLFFASLFLLCGNVLYAQTDSEIENRVRMLAHQLRCPTCQSQSVKDSDAGLSLNMKAKIRDLIQAGKSDGEILDYFVERYGEWILRSPPKSGFNLLLWVLPVVVMIIALLVLIRSMKQKKREPELEQESPLSKAEDKEISRQFKNVFKE
jgi:cytochrome c-type biogenesis protein CcmH